tara:strand:- start:2170 stop:2373 length:204 start_codon:yes stop_codon:yes gene_type:complete
MREKTIKIKVSNITPKQWTNLLLELNLVKKAWKPYGVEMHMFAPGIKNILAWGQKITDYFKADKKHD